MLKRLKTKVITGLFANTFDKNSKGLYQNQTLYDQADETCRSFIENDLPNYSGIIHFTVFRKNTMAPWVNGYPRFNIGKEEYHYNHYPSQACHGSLGRSENKGVALIATYCGMDIIEKNSNRITKAQAVKFYDFLVNHSPWAKTYLSKSGKEIMDQGYILTRTDLPSNLVMASCIASRRVYGYSREAMTLFLWLCEHLDKRIDHLTTPQAHRLAYLTTLLIGHSGSSNGYNFKADHSDSTLVNCSYTGAEGCAHFVYEGEPYVNLNSERFFSSSGYSGVASLFHSSGAKVGTMLTKAQKKCEKKCEKTSKDSWGNTVRTTYLSKEQVMDMVLSDLLPFLDKYKPKGE